MSIRDLLPKNKFDTSGITALKRLTYEELQQIVPDLLEWLQDMNWPVASDVHELLSPFADQLFPEFKKVLNSNDGIWKYWIISCFGNTTQDPRLVNEMKRIVHHPTQDEITEEVSIIAREILENRGIRW